MHSVWNPHHQSLIEKLKKVQKRATKLVFTVKKLCCEEKVTKTKITYFIIQEDKRRYD